MASEWTRRDTIGAMAAGALAGCSATSGARGGWSRVTAAAAFPGAYNFPVHVAGDGRFVALHPRGTWSSRNGRDWTREPLPFAGTAHAYLPHVQHAGASWVLGGIAGDYERFTIDPTVCRTADYRAWQTLGRSNRPPLIFPATTSFRGALWSIGGFDGWAYSAAIWRSADGLDWRRVVDAAPFGPGARARVVVFRDRLWVIGGGTIDGPVTSAVWSSADGIAWRREADGLADPQP